MISICARSKTGLHVLEWKTGWLMGGHWACVLEGCDYVEEDSTGHHGGHIVVEVLLAVWAVLLLAGLIGTAVWLHSQTFTKYEIWTKEGVRYANK